MTLPASAAKQERLKQARNEADREIAAYKGEREGAYQKKVSEVGKDAIEQSTERWGRRMWC